MSGSILVYAGLLLPIFQEQQPEAANPEQPALPTVSAMGDPDDLSYSTMLERMHDYRWMLFAPREGEKVETTDLVLEPGQIQRVSLTDAGAISHLWISSQMGKVRFYVDGATTPTLNWDLQEFAKSGVPEYLPYPMSVPLGLGWDVHLPLPFANSMEVEFEAPADFGLAVQLDVRRFGKGVRIDSVSEQLLTDSLDVIKEVARIVREGENPKSLAVPDPFKVGAARKKELHGQPGTSGDYSWHIGGKGMVRWMEITFIHKEAPAPVAEMLRGLELRLEHHTKEPLVEGETMFRVPLGDFFGSAHGANPFQSYLIGFDAQTNTFRLRLPIPFEDGIRIVVSSEFEKAARFGVRAGLDLYHIDSEMPPMRLHAGWKRAREVGKPQAATLKVDGPAHLAGYTFETTSPSLQPMGHTGAFRFADYWTAQTPGAFQHVTRRDGPLGYGRNGMIRTFALDAPSGAEGLEFHPGIVFPEADGPTDYSALAWFYAPEGTQHSMQTLYPYEQRIPAPLPEAKFLLVEDAMEAEAAPGVSLSEGCTYEVKTVIDPAVRWSRLQFAHFQPTKASDLVAFPFALHESGKYTIHAQFAKGEGYGQFEVLVDGRVIGEIVDGAGEGLTPGGEMEITTMRMMARNDHSLALRSLDGKAIGIDYFRIVPVKPKSEGEPANE
ncbi:MAG: DUF2961 domain-containing protein [Planctomycetota bacterium]